MRYIQPIDLYRITDERGVIEWTRGTGDNVELRRLRAAKVRQGFGTSLLQEMLRTLLTNPPYHTVFGFSRTVNTDAHEFYKASGFSLTTVEGVYADGKCVVFSGIYKTLLVHHKIISSSNLYKGR